MRVTTFMLARAIIQDQDGSVQALAQPCLDRWIETGCMPSEVKVCTFAHIVPDPGDDGVPIRIRIIGRVEGNPAEQAEFLKTIGSFSPERRRITITGAVRFKAPAEGRLRVSQFLNDREVAWAPLEILFRPGAKHGDEI